MTCDALIFDIDGTLWNASAASAKGWNLGLAKLGIERTVTAEEISRVAGRPQEECLDILLPGLRSKHPGLLDLLDDFETEAVRSEGGKFYEGVIEGITRLALDYKVFLVSNCQERYLELFLEFSGLRPVLSGTDCHGRSALPKSEMLSAMKRSHLLSNPVYIGDTAGDETAAQMAGMEFIFASWGFGQPQGKPETVHSFIDLMESLKKGRRPGDDNASC